MVDNRECKQECWRCGECCGGLAKGVQITPKELVVLEDEIRKQGIEPTVLRELKESRRLPTTYESGLQRCIFLARSNGCIVYDKRPEECRRFPVWTVEGCRSVTFVVSRICPRAEPLVESLRGQLPDWGSRLLRGRSYRVVAI